jgi:CheY-like chemotaxis protein
MPLTVLVVEDEYLVREIAVEALTAAGFDVLDAADGEEALAHCNNGTPDVLFTDVRLPGRVDGWDIAERCRQRHPALPVIYATAFSRDETRAVPGSILFRKPYTPEGLVNTIRALVDRG